MWLEAILKHFRQENYINSHFKDQLVYASFLITWSNWKQNPSIRMVIIFLFFPLKTNGRTLGVKQSLTTGKTSLILGTTYHISGEWVATYIWCVIPIQVGYNPFDTFPSRVVIEKLN